MLMLHSIRRISHSSLFAFIPSKSNPSPKYHLGITLVHKLNTHNFSCPPPPSSEPNITSYYSSLLQSCINKKAIKPGKQLHAHLSQSGIPFIPTLGIKLVILYSLCNYPSYAHNLFDKIPDKSIFLWNLLIRAYAWNGPHQLALSLYYQMLEYGLKPDNFTFPFVLKACSALSALAEGQDIHEHVKRCGWEFDIFVGAALIDMYSKCGCVQMAREVFDKIMERDAVLWNSMIATYAQNGQPAKALSLFREMLLMGFRPTEATLVTVVSASADIADLPRGREIHGFSWRRGFESQDKVKTALVDMYAKTGSLKIAKRLFDSLTVKRIVSWNAIIAGYGMHGHAAEALALFEKMKEEKFQPDHVTFVGVLSACSHGGLMEEGWKYFNLMGRDYTIEPRVQHYTCMVDLLGHSGRLDDAYNLIMGMRVEPDSGVWGALLNSCKLHRNIKLAELALQRLIDLEPDDAGNYVILSNIYAQAGKWEGVAQVRRLMTGRGLKKSTACSWIEVKNKVHAFLVGDTSHPQSNEILDELKRLGGLMKEAGYVPDTEPVFHDVEDDEKMNMVNGHSERLAIAFGLISTSPGTRLLVTKNLRVCDDCHTAIKFISKIVDREIVIRDVNRYHHFIRGVCSCGDYW